MVEKRIYIVGKRPPPLGGVTVHVDRLMKSLEADGIPVEFVDLSCLKFLSVVEMLLSRGLVHLHTSSSLFRFLFVLLGSVFPVSVMFTFHGELGRFRAVRNWMDDWSVRLAWKVIVLNQSSLDKSRVLNRKAELVSAFIPPLGTKLHDEVAKGIAELRLRAGVIFCTNAYAVSHDRDGNEIYGISQLVSIFEELPEYSLVISDPSGEYGQLLCSGSRQMPDNIKIISKVHDFFPVLKLTDCFIRCTTTDGDSLSVREAIFLKKPVIASDCIPRPEGCQLYATSSEGALRTALEHVDLSASDAKPANGYRILKEIYVSFNAK